MSEEIHQRTSKRRRDVFFDRSWYNCAIVEPLNGFCTDEEYRQFMKQVNEFEKMLVSSGIYLLKLYFFDVQRRAGSP